MPPLPQTNVLPTPVTVPPGISPGLFQAMPPHIQEIATRNPQLVQQLFHARKNRAQSAEEMGPTRFATIEEQSDEDDACEDERASLLRQRFR